MLPTTGAVTTADPTQYRSPFSHADEEAEPGYYRVGLTKYRTTAELTTTARTGWQRYTFPATGAANVLFNTGRANQSVFDSEIHVVGDRTVEGRVRAGNFLRRRTRLCSRAGGSGTATCGIPRSSSSGRVPSTEPG